MKLRKVLSAKILQKQIINCPFVKFTTKYKLAPEEETLIIRWPEEGLNAKSGWIQLIEAESVAKIAMLEMYKSIPQPSIKITEKPHKGVFVLSKYKKHQLVLPMFGQVHHQSKGSCPSKPHTIKNLATDSGTFFIKMNQNLPEDSCAPAAFVRCVCVCVCVCVFVCVCVCVCV